LPKRLSNGLWVASSGCGGILSWFDEQGVVVHRSKRWSEKSMIGSHVEVLDGDVVLVALGGLDAYQAGELVWTIEPACCFALSGDLLVTVAEIDDEVEVTTYDVRRDVSRPAGGPT
jgi:hypothetical protein